MLAHFSRPLRFLIGISIFATWLAACGGGGGGGGGGMQAPSGLSYPSVTAFTVNQAIAPLTPTVSGTVTSYTVSPALPAGLELSAATGVISGTPTAVTTTASYTVTASNASGSTTASVSLTVNAQVGAPSIAYASPAYSFTAGVQAQTIVPTATGGAVASWDVSPALPAGLIFGTNDGSISGTPTAAAAAGTYTVTASNSGGQSTVKLNLAVSSAPLLDLGHITQIIVSKASGTAALTQDANGHWVLWNLSTGANVAHGDNRPNFEGETVDLAGSIMAVQTTTGLEVRSASTGSVMAEIAAALPSGSWWTIASDGSYLCAGTATALTAWSPTGSQLFSVSGNYSAAVAYAAPTQVQVVMGPAGNFVIQNFSLPTGTATLTPAFVGQFQSWFGDGQHFFATVTGVLYIYSSAGALQNQVTLAGNFEPLSGIGNWFSTSDGLGDVDVYAVGGGAVPVSTYTGIAMTFAYGTNLLLLNSGKSPANAQLVDLSGNAPVATTYTLPAFIGYWNSFAASSSSNWILGSAFGVVVQALAAPASFQNIDYGAATAMAGSSANFAIATASGRILYFDATSNTQQGTINAFSALPGEPNSLALSSDGTVLATAALAYPASPNLNIYSLPSGSLSYSFPSTPTVTGISLSSSGTDLGVGLNVATPCGNEEVAITGGSALWCDTTGIMQQVQLSPDGTLVAASQAFGSFGFSGPTTTIFSGGNAVATVPGWVLGWLNTSTFLVDEFNLDEEADNYVYVGSQIFNSSGAVQSSPDLPQFSSMQVVSSNTIYGAQYNAIYSTVSGAMTWTSGSTRGELSTDQWLGAVAGSQAIFTSGTYVLAEPIH